MLNQEKEKKLLRILEALVGIGLLNLSMVLVYATLFIALAPSIPLWCGQAISVSIILLASIGMYLIADSAIIPFIQTSVHAQKKQEST